MFAELLFAVALTAAPADVAPVQPVTLEYEVFRNDKPMGKSTIRLAKGAGGTWTLETNTEGTSGLAGLAGAGIAERSEFAWRDGHPELRQRVMTTVYKFEAMQPGHRIEGPSLVEAEFTTLVVPPGQVFHIDSRGLGILEYTKGGAQA